MTSLKQTVVALMIAAIPFTGCDKDNPGNEKAPEKEPVKVLGVSLNKTTLALAVDVSEILTAAVVPNSAENRAVTRKNGKLAVAAVDTEGKVTAVAEGTAVITVTTDDGAKTASCTVTVSKPTMDHSKGRSDDSSERYGDSRYRLGRWFHTRNS